MTFCSSGNFGLCVLYFLDRLLSPQKLKVRFGGCYVKTMLQLVCVSFSTRIVHSVHVCTYVCMSVCTSIRPDHVCVSGSLCHARAEDFSP